MASIFDEELAIVWPKLTLDAMVTADGIHKNEEFGEVVESRPIEHGYVALNVGNLVKRGSTPRRRTDQYTLADKSAQTFLSDERALHDGSTLDSPTGALVRSHAVQRAPRRTEAD